MGEAHRQRCALCPASVRCLLCVAGLVVAVLSLSRGPLSMLASPVGLSSLSPSPLGAPLQQHDAAGGGVVPSLGGPGAAVSKPAPALGGGVGRTEPQRDTSVDAVIALAAYSKPVSSFNLAFVNTLRGVGFRGKVFLGVWEGTEDPDGYLAKAEVTPMYLVRAPCKLRYELAAGASNYEIRNVCTVDFPHLKLEWARFLYARRWLEQCSTCTGWALHADYGDVNFQRNPFGVLPDNGQVPSDTVFLTEEMQPRVDAEGGQRGVTTSHWFVHNAVRTCYGEEAADKVANHPMLNVATTLGPRAGMLRWLGRMEEEFEKLSTRAECDPNKIADQAVFNYLVYVQDAMPWAVTKKYGAWIVNTMGLPCSNQPGKKPDHSMEDIVIIDSAGRVWNEDGTLPAVVHQGKTCHNNYMLKFVNRFSGQGALGTYDAELCGFATGRFPGPNQPKKP